MSVFVHTQTVHAAGGGVKKWQNSVHIVVECPLSSFLFDTFRRVFSGFEFQVGKSC